MFLFSRIFAIGAALVIAASALSAKPKQTSAIPLDATGKKLETQYEKILESITKEIVWKLPKVSTRDIAEFEGAKKSAAKAVKDAEKAKNALNKINEAKGLIGHAEGKWIGGAEKGIAKTKALLKAASTEAERAAASKELEHWEENKLEGLKALKKRTAAYEKLKTNEPKLKRTHEKAQATLKKAKADERKAANSILSSIASVLGSGKLDPKLTKAAILHHATPRGLAGFAQVSSEKSALVEKLLADQILMKDMLVAGGASFGKYGRAMEILTEIQQASPKANQGIFYHLALATSLEHARPIKQLNPKDATDAPNFIDPVKRYLHYEQAFLNGELDPAFDTFTAWEYRHIVNCDAPDETLTWGRQMLRTYRPDHIYNANYGWRYVAAVKTEIPYGSQNVKYDSPSLQKYENILMNSGVCGRRAFFGRFLLRSFGIPTWGVTQHKHAAVSHWTPDGWVVNLGAGFHKSWWDKDEVSLGGKQFLLESQAREHNDEYVRVLRAKWISRILGEEAYNERRKVPGGLWSRMAHFYSLMLSEKSVDLGPLGQELGEANEKIKKMTSAEISVADSKITLNSDGSITIPAVAFAKKSGKASAMKSFSGGMQLHCLGGFKTRYKIKAAETGKYHLTARIAAAQIGQKFHFTVGSDQMVETTVPYTKGLWEQTKPIELNLSRGANTLYFELKKGSRGVTIKEFILTPVK